MSYGKTWIFYTDYDIIISGQKREKGRKEEMVREERRKGSEAGTEA